MKRIIGSLLFLAMLAGPARAQDLDAPLDNAAQKRAVAEIAGLLRDHYIDPDLGDRAARALEQRLADGGYAEARKPHDMAIRLTDDLRQATGDQHLEVISRAEDTVAAPARSNGGFVRVDRLKGGIGYLELDQFVPLGLFAPFADEAMKRVAGTDALIIDLRDNIGGSASSVIYFGSFFFGSPTHVDELINRTPKTKDFTTTALMTLATPTPYLGKPVYILTSRKTFSGAEELADELQAQGRAKVVGEATAGGANAGQSWRLIGGQLQVFVPSSRWENPVTRSNWAATGVKPDLATPSSGAFVAALQALAPQQAAGLRPDAGADQALDAHLMPLRSRPQPGGEQAVRKLLADLLAGTPDYARMDTDIAAATRRMAPDMKASLERLGPIQSITFQDIGPVGGDEYVARFAKGAAVVMIYREDDGRLAAYAIALPDSLL
ncbi:MAG TPA: S41 family peptidase [Caulobacteraceae bacterium]|jgi:hypothetical protein